jgi:hypothetical protein
MKPLAAVVLLLGAGLAALAQSAQRGSLLGRLTDLGSHPLPDVMVVARNEATGVEARATTTKNGSFRFSDLVPGEYTIMASGPQLGRGHVEAIVISAGYEAQVQAAMEFEPLPAEAALAELRKMQRPEIELEQGMVPVEEEALAAVPLRTMVLAALVNPYKAQDALPALTAKQRPKVFSAVKAGGSSVQSEKGEIIATSPLPTKQIRDKNGVPAGVRIWTEPAVVQNQTESATAAGKSAGLSLAVQGGGQISTSGSGSGVGAAGGYAAVRVIPTAQSPPLRRAVETPSHAADSAAPSVTTTMSAQELQALPANGRRWQNFVLDSPAAAIQTGEQAAATSVDGAGKGLAFDGGKRENERGASGPGRNEAGGLSGHGLALSEAAIREVQVVAGNVEAETARAAGGRVNAETRSGGNELHGQGFVYDKQNAWGALDPLTQWVKETAPAVLTYNPAGPPLSVPVFGNGPNGTPQSYTPPDRETTWGIGVGSRIRRDKLFWFAALDAYNRNDAGVSMLKHPYLAQTLSGCEFAPCTGETGFFIQPTNCEMQVLSSRLGLAKQGQPLDCSSGLIPGLAAYSPMLEKLAGLLGPAPRTARQWTAFARLDWQAGERHHITLEGVGTHWNSPGGGLTGLSEHYGNHSFGSSKASEEWLLGRWEAFLTPNLRVTTQASAGRTILQARPSTPSAFEQTFLTGNAYGQLPQIVVDSRYGFTIGNPSRFGAGSYPDEHLYQGQEAVNWIHGKLMAKAGFQIEHSGDAISLLRNQTGTYSYANVENFISDALVFGKFGLSGLFDPANPHNCDQTGKVWENSGGVHGIGLLPCYNYYSQTMGPADWRLSTNDWAGFATAQWQPEKLLVLSAGLRLEREQMPPALATLKNQQLPQAGLMPSLGIDWGPRVSLALGSGKGRWPVLRLGYGIYFGRTSNLTLETALTQTGSTALDQNGQPKGDLNFFLRPTDDNPNNGGGAPLFPEVLTGPPLSIVKPGAVEFSPNYRNPEVHQAIAALEEELPGHVRLTASAMVSLGRRLPISIDTNFAPLTSQQTITYGVVDGTGKGPIKSPQITVPFYASWPSATGFAGRLNPDYQQIVQIMSRANSTYEAITLQAVRYGRKGLSLHAHYTYAHATDWNPNESAQVSGSDVLDPADFKLEYGTSNLDVRHTATAMVVWEMPWKLHTPAGKLANGWMLSGVGHFRSGLPYTMRTADSIPEEFSTGTAIAGLGPGMNGSGGDNRVYGLGSDNSVYNLGRNTFRYPATWKLDMRLGKRFDFGKMRQLELLAESFNLFNHQNVTELETTGYTIGSGSPSGTLPTLNFLNGLKANSTAFGKPLNSNATDFYRARQFQVGLKMRF